MTVNEVSSSMYLSDQQPRTPVKELGKDQFLQLLVAQMKYQDPLQPMDNNQYIAQMAQLSSVEQITNLTQSFSTMQGYSLVGKTVTATVVVSDLGTTEEVTGKVTKMMVNGSAITLLVGGKEIKLGNVKEVLSEDGGTNQPTP